MLRPIPALILILALPGSGSAQSTLTLDEAVARALAANPRVHAAAAAEREARARTDQARAGYLPRIDVTEGWQRGNHPVFVFGSLLAQQRFTEANFAIDSLNHPAPVSAWRAAVTIEQTLFDGARTRAAVQSARIGETIADLDAARTAAELRLAVVRAYGRAFAAASAHQEAVGALAAADADLQRTEARRDAGLETEASVLALRVYRAEAEARRITAAAGESNTRAALNALMQVPLEENRPLAEPARPALRDLDEEALTASALANRPEIRQAALVRDQSSAIRKIAGSAFLPQVVAQGLAEANGHTFTDRASSWTAGVALRWNLFAGGADAARRREAIEAGARAEAERLQRETDVRLEVRGAVADYRAAVARGVAAREMVGHARESQRIVRDRYEAGLAPANDLLRSAEAVLRAEATRTAAVVDVTIAAAALARATGTDTRKDGTR